VFKVQYVLDGGAHIQRIPWSHGSTYKDICQLYTDYVTQKYGEAVIVFDGYEGTSTEVTTHQRRANRKTGTTVTFDENKTLGMKKEEFTNKRNKQQFINMLSSHLQHVTCQTCHAPGDADLLIV
jgi:hypothetical protein